jgi:hypothetical protein
LVLELNGRYDWKNFDFLGLSMCFVAFYDMAVIPHSLALYITLDDVDPYNLMLRDLGIAYSKSFMAKLIRFFSLWFVIANVFQLAAMCELIVIHVPIMFQTCLRSCVANRRSYSVLSEVQYYRQISIISNTMTQGISTIWSMLLIEILCLVIVINFALIRLTHMLPIGVSVLIPLSTGAMAYCYFVISGEMARVGETSSELIRFWKSSRKISIANRYNCKEAKSLQSILFYSGMFGIRFRTVDRDGIAQFAMKVVDSTIIALLTIPK